MDRILTNTGANLFVTFYSDDTAVDADGAVTVTVTDGDDVVLATNAATTKPAQTTGKYQWMLPAQSAPKLLKLEWTGTFGGVVSTVVTEAEVVGGRFFTLAAARAADPVLAQVKYTAEMLDAARLETEDEFETITGRSPFKRWGMTGVWNERAVAHLQLKHYDVDTILSVEVDGVAYTQTERDNLVPLEFGLLLRKDGTPWPTDCSIIVTYTYGMNRVTSDLVAAGVKRLRTRLVDPQSGIPERATSLTSPEGGTFQLATPGRAGFETGIPDVDAVYKRYSLRPLGVA